MTTDTTPSLPTTDTDPDRPIIALAWPTGRPIHAYTVAELAEGVDLYTRRLKAMNAAEGGDAHAS